MFAYTHIQAIESRLKTQLTSWTVTEVSNNQTFRHHRRFSLFNKKFMMMIRMNKRVRRRTSEKKKKDHQKEIVCLKIDFEQWRNIYSTNIHRWYEVFSTFIKTTSVFTLHWRHIVCDYDASQLIYRTIACLKHQQSNERER